jgi:hypothetical protein
MRSLPLVAPYGLTGDQSPERLPQPPWSHVLNRPGLVVRSPLDTGAAGVRDQ